MIRNPPTGSHSEESQRPAVFTIEVQDPANVPELLQLLGGFANTHGGVSIASWKPSDSNNRSSLDITQRVARLAEVDRGRAIVQFMRDPITGEQVPVITQRTLVETQRERRGTRNGVTFGGIVFRKAALPALTAPIDTPFRRYFLFDPKIMPPKDNWLYPAGLRATMAAELAQDPLLDGIRTLGPVSRQFMNDFVETLVIPEAPQG